MMHRRTRSRWQRWRKTVAVLASATAALALVSLTQEASVAATPKAFPGAEGFGTDTPGGRGGTICQVTNLNDSGAGSFRACATASGPRVVIFRTGGTINLQSRINVLNPNMTILGHTAPGDGITLRMAPGSNTDAGTMQIETHDIVVRYLRFRPGNPDGTADDSHDGVQIYKAGVNNVVIDHSSVSWAVDENVNTYDESDNITVSWSIISEALRNAGHPDGEHSKGMLSGGVNAHNVSIHHNLFASNVDRNPQISGVSVADVRNNVMFNYGDGSGDGTTLISSSKGHPQVNIVNNYYRKGASSPANYPDWALYSGDNGCVHQVHVSGNKHDESGTVTNATRGSGCDSTAPLASPHAAPAVTTTSAEQAYADVLASAGASKVRDAVDQRIIAEVQNRTGSFKDDAPSYPTLATGTPPADSDGDGLPDSWESSGGGTDPNGDVDADGYTNIEEWAESLIGGSTPPPPPGNTPPSVNAGSDAAVTLPASANLDGTVSDPDAGDTVTTTWSKVSGPGTVTFGNASNVDTTASFSVDGTYVLRLSANDGTVTVTDDVQVTVSPENTPPPTNMPPDVSAGGDQTITLPDDTADLNGTVADDGLVQPVSTMWEKFSGPGTVTFGNPASIDTTATFSTSGTYVLLVTADDGEYETEDTVTITVNPESTPPPPPPSGDVTFVGQSKAFSESGSVSVPMPAGAQTGDTVVLFVLENQGTAAKVTVDQPLEVIPLNLEANDGSSLGARVFYHEVDANSPANFTFGGAHTQMGVHAVAYRNVDSVAIAGFDTDDNSDANHHVDGTTLAPAVNVVFAGDRVYASGAVPSTWTLGAGLTERGEGQGPKSGSAFSTVVGDTVTPVAAGAQVYDAIASESSPYAISALVELR